MYICYLSISLLPPSSTLSISISLPPSPLPLPIIIYMSLSMFLFLAHGNATTRVGCRGHRGHLGGIRRPRRAWGQAASTGCRGHPAGGLRGVHK